MGKKSKASEFLEDSKTLKIGKRITVSQVYTKYVEPELRAKNRRESTVTCLARDVRRFAAWWETITTEEQLPIGKIRRKHLEAFRSWLKEQGHSVALQNGAIRSILQVLHAAVKHELITHAPKLESLQHNGVAPKVFPSDEEICRIWEATEQATWPKRDSDLRPLPYSAADAWKSAIVMYRTYGMRTQELVQLEDNFRSLRWSNITVVGLTPNPVGRCECDHGWLSYVPQKQERMKSDSLFNPLNQYTRAAIELVRTDADKPEDRIYNWPLSAVSFRKQWDRLLEIAHVKPRDTSGVEKYTIKHLRKAATTQINNHAPGIAEHIVGHGGDRSGQANQSSLVSGKHYNNPEQAVLACVLSMPLPECFGELLA
jgi:hypothetical protein